MKNPFRPGSLESLALVVAACSGGGSHPAPTVTGNSGWETQASTDSESIQGPHAVCVLDGETAFTAGERGEILATTDGGLSAARVSPSSVTEALDGLHFASASDGWAVGADGRVLHTGDGGTSWSSFQLVLDNVPQYTLHLSGVYAEGDVVCIVGWFGHVFVSFDGGESFDSLTGDSTDYHAVAFSEAAPYAGHGLIVGARGTIFATDDGGASWYPEDSGTSADLYGVYMAPGDSDHGWAVGDGVLLHTSDGGVHWAAQTVAGAYLRAVTFSGSRGWITGLGGVILATRDGGGSWSRQTTPSTLVPIESIAMVDADHGWAVGTDAISGGGLVLHTDTAGQ